ncbi:MAG: ribonuclease HII [Lentisphaeria bacterium]|nr:ribonuclease HII [Lentisphaeria bacterium]
MGRGRRRNITQDDELLRTERELRAEGFHFIAGVDEAGRGPLAGPVVAAAVILPDLAELPGVFDSKQLTDAERRLLRDELLALPGIVYAVAESDNGVIDGINILNATHRAMRQAVLSLDPPADFVLVDGLPVKGFPVPCRNLVKGDALSAAIAAASILAKVHRDELMERYDTLYPGYGFAAHKGYGTAEHLEALRRLGPSPIHRTSFRPVRELLAPPPKQPELF